MASPQHKDIDEYATYFPKDVQEIINKIRKLVSKIEPEATETISYNIPTFLLNGHYFFYFSANKKHIGIYPSSDDMEQEIPELKNFRSDKATIQLPYTEPFRYDLVEAIVKFKAKEARKTKGTKK